jgi:hypothetical protein
MPRVFRVVSVAAHPMPDDGVEFRPQTVTSRVIRGEVLYSGVRIAMDCALASAIVKLRLDVNLTAGRTNCVAGVFTEVWISLRFRKWVQQAYGMPDLMSCAGNPMKICV